MVTNAPKLPIVIKNAMKKVKTLVNGKKKENVMLIKNNVLINHVKT